MKQYNGGWKGTLSDKKIFHLSVEIDTKSSTFKVYNSNFKIEKDFTPTSKEHFKINITDQIYFTGYQTEDEIRGFINSGFLFYHITLTKNNAHTYSGNWDILIIDELKANTLYLSVENGSEDNYEAYPIFADNTFTGTWCTNFQKEGNTISFSDFKTGLQFKGTLKPNVIDIAIHLGSETITTVQFTPEKEWKVGELSTPNFQYSKNGILKKMEELVLNDSFPNTHSILISRNNELIYEQYFNGYNTHTLHDTRSASKSMVSAIVGIAKDQNLFQSTDQSIFEFVPSKYQMYNEGLKSKIDIHSLLTMSSGLDAIDFGIERSAVASEDNYQNTPDWFESILKAPMLYAPNLHANYGSANPALLGLAIDHMVSEPLELYMDKALFEKIDVNNYIIQKEVNGSPYFGGGMYFTPTQMLKFGQLYLNKGKNGSEQVISGDWVERSFKNYRPLENTPTKNGYGYLWWHETYTANQKNIESIEARGAGGQYIFVVPSLQAVVVITSGNYRNKKFNQPESIFENHILPFLLK